MRFINIENFTINNNNLTVFLNKNLTLEDVTNNKDFNLCSNLCCISCPNSKNICKQCYSSYFLINNNCTTKTIK